MFLKVGGGNSGGSETGRSECEALEVLECLTQNVRTPVSDTNFLH